MSNFVVTDYKVKSCGGCRSMMIQNNICKHEFFDIFKMKLPKEKARLGKNFNVEDFPDLIALLSQKHSIYYLLHPNLPDEFGFPTFVGTSFRDY